MCAECKLVLGMLFSKVPLARIMRRKAELISHLASKSLNADNTIVPV
jgi:hypothetical protein